MRWLETRIPPPVVMVVMGIGAYGAARLLPALAFAVPMRTSTAVVVALAGVALNLIPKLAFDRAGTTINPLQPNATTALVTSGIYRYTRNPMYLGQAVFLFGWTLYLQNAAALLAVPLFVLYITRFQIKPEERFLSERFPDEYAAFRRRTSRWL